MAKKGRQKQKHTAAPESAAPGGAKLGPSGWSVAYHDGAVQEYASFKDAKDRKKVLTVVALLRELGPKLIKPHSDQVHGTNKLRELRPGGGKALIRPLYAQVDQTHFVIFAVAPEAQVNESGFDAAVKRAVKRAKDDYGLDL
jgi:hypothetical protein